MVWSSEDSSSLELGLGLSLGGSCCAPTQQGCTAQDLLSLSKASVTLGTNRRADSAPNDAGQVVGWPPVRAYRMNILSNRPKSQAIDKNKSLAEKTINDGSVKEKGRSMRSSFVKVNMDGSAIGRKVDLNVLDCYETLSQTLEDMFLRSTTTSNHLRDCSSTMIGRTELSKLLDGTSGLTLTYEDKDGDWMLVGDVPWRMFIDSVKRLRIMRTSEANGLAPRIKNSAL